MKKAALFILTALLLMSFAACGNTQKLSSEYDESVVLSKAEAVIGLIHDGDFTSVEYMVKDELKSQLSAEILKDVMDPLIDKAGKFDSFGTEKAVGTTAKDGTAYAVAVIEAKYENATMIYTISFDKDYHIVGFYIK